MATPQEGRAEAYTIREGSAADTERVLGLVRLSLGEGTIPRDTSYWEWKHCRNPFGASPMLLAEAGDDLIGLRVFMRWQWVAGGRSFHAVRAVDTATHPAWQGRGIFKKLTLALVDQAAQQQVDFVFNTPNEQSRPGYLKMGWTAVGRTETLIMPVRPLRILRSLTRRGGAVDAMDEKATHASPFDGAGALGSVGMLPELLDSAAGGAPSARLMTRRSVDYLKWRYAEIPGFNYYMVHEGTGSDGALILFRYKRRGALLELRICDLLIGQGSRSAALAVRLVRQLRHKGGADYISGMASRGTTEKKVLLRSGFLPGLRIGPILTVRPLAMNRGSIDPARKDSWGASIGDLELF
jgi:GNAT superfamily N-acetyltransferase